MDWRKQVETHIADAREQQLWLCRHLASDQQAKREIPNPAGLSVLGALGRIEQRIRNARNLIEANGPWPEESDPMTPSPHQPDREG